MQSELTKNNSTTSDKAILIENLKEISLSDEFGKFSTFPKKQKKTQTQANSTALDNELGPKKTNSMQISQRKKHQTTKLVDNQFKLINVDPDTGKNETTTEKKSDNSTTPKSKLGGLSS